MTGTPTSATARSSAGSSSTSTDPVGQKWPLLPNGWSVDSVGSSGCMPEPTIAVLDVDGTLVDSNYQHALAWYRALRSVGETFPIWRLHRLVGMGGDNLVLALGGEELDERIGEEARKRQAEEVDALIDEVAPLPGAR